LKIMIDDAFFCIGNTGIARVWRETMQTISKHTLDKDLSLDILILNRTGALQNLGFMEVTFPSYNEGNAHADRVLIDKVVEHYEVDLFISSYYTWTSKAKNLGVFYDFIPEVFSFEQINESWQQRVLYCHIVDGVFCISQSTMNDGLRYYKRFENLKRIVSLPGSSHVFQHSPSPRSTPLVPAKTLGRVSVGKPFLLTVGLGSAEYKNRKLVERIVTSRNCPVNLLTIGGLQLDPTIVELAGALGTNIVHLSEVDDKELFAWGVHSAGLLFPSLYEGFGLPVAEFCQLGIPVLTTATSSLPEASNGGVTFITGEDPEEAILAISKMIGNRPLTPKRYHSRPPKTWEGFAGDLLRFAQDLGGAVFTQSSQHMAEDSILASTKLPHSQ